MTWLRKNLVLILGLLVLVYTFIPIFVVILMSFNDPDRIACISLHLNRRCR